MSDGKQIAGAALLSGLLGYQRERDENRDFEASMVRQEAFTRLNNRIQRENSPSGWVHADSGQPIRQAELDTIPVDKRVTAADYALQMGKKGYEAEREWTKAEREELRQQELEDKEADRQLFLMDREYNENLWEERYGNRGGGDRGGMTDNQFLDMESKLWEQYQMSGAGEPKEEGGIFGIGAKEVAGQPFEEFVKENAPPAFRDIYLSRTGMGGGRERSGDNGGNEGDIVQPQPIRQGKGEAQAADILPDNEVKTMIDSLRGNKGGGKEAGKLPTEKTESDTVQPPPSKPEEGEPGLLSRKLDEWKDMPKEEKISAKEKREIGRQKSFIIKNMSPQQKQEFYKLSPEEQELYILRIIKR